MIFKELIIGAILSLIVGLILIYREKIFNYFLKALSYCHKKIKKSFNMCSQPIKIINKERIFRTETIIGLYAPKYVDVYFKPPTQWNFMKLNVILFFIATIITVLTTFLGLFKEVTMVVIIYFICDVILILKNKQQEINLKNKFFTKEGIPWIKKKGQFHLSK